MRKLTPRAIEAMEPGLITLVDGLLERMAAKEAAFLGPVSARFRSYADFERAGIARL